MADATIARRYFVSGAVQGVGYRYFARHAATRLGLYGYARNLRDGRVEVYAIGRAEAVHALHKELQDGPPAASVENVAIEETAIEMRFSGHFSIEYDL